MIETKNEWLEETLLSRYIFELKNKSKLKNVKNSEYLSPFAENKCYENNKYIE
jgi:hypothetical protein